MGTLPKPCAAPGCPELTTTSRCTTHRRKRAGSDRRRRGSAASRGYDRHHRKWRKAVLAKDPLCVLCLARGRVEPSTVADHKVPLSQGGERFSLGNGQGMCTTCHNRKTARERA